MQLQIPQAVHMFAKETTFPASKPDELELLRLLCYLLSRGNINANKSAYMIMFLCRLAHALCRNGKIRAQFILAFPIYSPVRRQEFQRSKRIWDYIA